ncbi:hypothetical protein G6O69_22700 [Pseudenhygromyxa sp. WMMC2535]|uniref:hypothetical protein n=1 Tax=Pseudenhygromyxa sp. WMMC2535 TaxID=2712867 RepID=UPI0015516DE7|nr:hypothetical protein [Pseudenhygromyxa sp. WMMC2535]NVB40666.1 hypothetical protein [Pseudenhygromyxa sp. WMMC2535]
MTSRSDHRAATFVVLVLAVVSMTAGRALWADPGLPWWSPFALWLAMLVCGLGLSRGGKAADAIDDEREGA